MLRCLHYMPEEKKRAAKLLIEEMVTMEDEIRTMIFDAEHAHEKINSLIISSERMKQENEYLSQLLFGADSTSHHFDNMKLEINDLIDRIGLERD
jgi:seryl-tRNA synthetase